MLARSSGVTRSSASRLKIHSWVADSAANCFCAAKPGQSRAKTRAPHSRAISRVASVERESTTTTSSAQATDSHASRIFADSLQVMMVAEIFKAIRRLSFPAREREYGRRRRSVNLDAVRRGLTVTRAL